MYAKNFNDGKKNCASRSTTSKFSTFFEYRDEMRMSTFVFAAMESRIIGCLKHKEDKNLKTVGINSGILDSLGLCIWCAQIAAFNCRTNNGNSLSSQIIWRLHGSASKFSTNWDIMSDINSGWLKCEPKEWEILEKIDFMILIEKT